MRWGMIDLMWLHWSVDVEGNVGGVGTMYSTYTQVHGDVKMLLWYTWLGHPSSPFISGRIVLHVRKASYHTSDKLHPKP